MRIGFVLFVSIAVLGCSDSRLETVAVIGQRGGTIVAANGTFVLKIPEGAIPEDAIPDGADGVEIRIRRVLESKPLSDDDDDDLRLFGFQVGPETLEFEKPVSVCRRVVGQFAGFDGKLLGRWQDMTVVKPGTVRTVVDGDAGTVFVEGELDGFGTGVIEVGELGGVTFELAPVPECLGVGESFTVRVAADVDALGAEATLQATYTGSAGAPLAVDAATPDDDVPLFPGGVTIPPGEAVESERVFTYRCTAAGTALFEATIMFVEDGRECTIVFRRTIECKGDAPPPEPPAEVQTLPQDGVEEVSVLLPRLAEALRGLLGADSKPGTSLLTAAHTQGFTLFDLDDGESIPAQNTVAFDLIGSVPLVRRDATDAIESLVLWGYGGSNFFRATPAPGGFSQFLFNDARFAENYTDGLPYGGDPEGGGATFVDFGRGFVRFVEWRGAPFDAFQPSNDQASLAVGQLPGATGNPISAYSESATADVFVVTDGQPGQLWRWPRGAEEATLVGDVGNDPRRVRGCGGLMLVSNLGSDSVTVARCDGSGACEIVQSVAVGAAPLGIDCKETESGDIAVASSGSADDSWTLTLLDPLGGTVSNETLPAPDGCTGPFHARWAGDGRLALSCTTSGVVVIFPVTLPR